MILDNGRSNLARRRRYREMLACIRCGACLNVCPVYRKTGGAAYGPVYSGPMGAVLVPLLVGLEQAPTCRTPRRSAAPAPTPARSRSRCTSCCSSCAATSSSEGVAPCRERLAFRLWSLRVVVAARLPALDARSRGSASRSRASSGRAARGRTAARCRGSAAASGTADDASSSSSPRTRRRRASSSTAARRRRSTAPASRRAVLRARRHGQRRARGVAGRAARAARCCRTSTSRCSPRTDPPGAGGAVRRRSATTCRARSRSSPGRAGAPTSSRSSPSACTAPARCTSCSRRDTLPKIFYAAGEGHLRWIERFHAVERVLHEQRDRLVHPPTTAASPEAVQARRAEPTGCLARLDVVFMNLPRRAPASGPRPQKAPRASTTLSQYARCRDHADPVRPGGMNYWRVDRDLPVALVATSHRWLKLRDQPAAAAPRRSTCSSPRPGRR